MIPAAAPAPSTVTGRPARSYSRPVARDPFDDELPELPPPPRPSGWFEPLCCGAIVLAFAAILVVIALLSR